VRAHALLLGGRVGAGARAALCALAFAVSLASAAQAQQAVPAPGVAFSPAPVAEPTLVLRTQPGELAVAPRELRLHADGRCELVHPLTGRHVARLPAARIRALLDEAVAAGLVETDAHALRARLRARERAARASGAAHVYHSDPERIEIELRLADYRGADGRVQRDVVRRFAWRGLRRDRALHPDDPTLRRLADLVGQLEAVASGPELAGAPAGASAAGSAP